MANKTKGVKCSFCGKSQEAVGRIIAGPGVYICDECIKVCNNILEEEIYELADQKFNISSPKQLGEIIFDKLNLSHGKKIKTGFSTNIETFEVTGATGIAELTGFLSQSFHGGTDVAPALCYAIKLLETEKYEKWFFPGAK